MSTLPYKDTLYAANELGGTDSEDSELRHNPLCFESLEHPLNAGVAQWSERSAYTREVAGSTPAACTNHPFKEIPLTRGYVALVSPEDYPRVAPHKWTAMPIKDSRLVYARRSVWGDDGKCRTILLHRFISKAPDGVLVDHRDGNGLDCRRHNIRSATYSQNGFNKRARRGPSGFIGVSSQTPNRWRGVVACNGQRYYTKTFPSPTLAAAARDALARQLHGEFAVTNFNN